MVCYAGACIVGLGEKIAALYSSDDALLADLQAAAKRTDEVVWAMPLESSYKESIKGSITDLKNLSGAKGGGSITAALFLQEFVEKTPWAHIDMAGKCLCFLMFSTMFCGNVLLFLWDRSCLARQQAHWFWCQTVGGLFAQCEEIQIN